MTETQGANPVIFCTQCGAANPAIARFCDSCGTPFGAAPTPPPYAYSPPMPPMMPQAMPGASPYPLYDQRSVAIATFIGAPLGGSIVMAMNYRRLGQMGAAIIAVVAGLALTWGSYVVGTHMPPVANKILPVLLMFGMMGAAASLQGQSVEQHARSGGAIGSRWRAAAIGLAVLVPLAIAIFANVIRGPSTQKVTLGMNDEVYYSGQATQQDALMVGQALQLQGYFQDRGVAAFVSKDETGATLGFVVQDGIWDNQQYIDGFERITRAISPVLGGTPIRLHLLNSNRDVKREVMVQ